MRPRLQLVVLGLAVCIVSLSAQDLQSEKSSEFCPNKPDRSEICSVCGQADCCSSALVYEFCACSLDSECGEDDLDLETDYDSDSIDADKRSRRLIGKRGRKLIGKRGRKLIGKRGRKLIGKRGRKLIG